MSYSGPAGNSGRRVLVVEDDAVNQRVAMKMLERFGCSVHIAASGREALEVIQFQSFDAVFLDCHMPEMDGYETARKLRQTSPDNLRIPIIAMTANVLPGDREKCLAAGMDDFVGKPITFEHLEEMLDRWVGVRKN